MTHSIPQKEARNGTASFVDYERFAWLFNQEWAFFGSHVFDTIGKITEGQLPAEARILDLCCGTGQLARVLTERGYRVTGLDASAEMLSFARKNSPAAEFILGDARNFRLPPVFDAVFCTFDSLNHLMSAQDLKRAFRNVRGCLASGGIFVFDLNTELAYKTEWKGYLDMKEKPEYLYVNRADYDARKRIGFTRCTAFRRDGRVWRRSDTKLFQKYHPPAKVKLLLQDTGFVGIRLYAPDNKRGYHKFTKKDTRVFFACRRGNF